MATNRRRTYNIDGGDEDMAGRFISLSNTSSEFKVYDIDTGESFIRDGANQSSTAVLSPNYRTKTKLTRNFRFVYKYGYTIDSSLIGNNISGFSINGTGNHKMVEFDIPSLEFIDYNFYFVRDIVTDDMYSIIASSNSSGSSEEFCLVGLTESGVISSFVKLYNIPEDLGMSYINVGNTSNLYIVSIKDGNILFYAKDGSSTSNSKLVKYNVNSGSTTIQDVTSIYDFTDVMIL